MCVHSFSNTTCDIKATDAGRSAYRLPRRVQIPLLYSLPPRATTKRLLGLRHGGLRDETITYLLILRLYTAVLEQCSELQVSM